MIQDIASDKQIPELLRQLSRQTLDGAYLGTVNGSDIYQVQTGWQREVLAVDAAVTSVSTVAEFEDAVISEKVASIFVPKAAALTQAIAERILLRHPLSKTIYWEAVTAAS